MPERFKVVCAPYKRCALLLFLMKLLYAGPVNTGMGDRIGIQLLVQEFFFGLTNHTGQLSLAIPPWIGAISTG